MASAKASVAITTLGNFAGPLVGLVTAPLLAGALGPAGRGELAAATAPLLLSVNMATLGLPDALVYYSARKGAGHRNFVLKACIALGVMGFLSSGIIYYISGPLSAGDSELARLICLAGLGASPSLILAGIRGVASGYQAWTLVTAERLINSSTRLIAMLIAYAMDALSLNTAVAITVATTFVGIIAYTPLRRVSTKQKIQSTEYPNLGDIFSFGLRLWAGSLTGILLLRLDQSLLVPLAGSYELGIYAVAVTISEMALIFNTAVAAVMYARESNTVDTHKLGMATRISTAVTIMGCIFIGMSAIWAIPFFFGSEFQSAIPVLWILLLGVVLGNSGSVAGAGLNGRGRPGLRSISLTTALVANVALLILLAPGLGAIGAAVATLCGNVIAGFLNLLWLKTVFKARMGQFLGIRKSDINYLATLAPHRR